MRFSSRFSSRRALAAALVLPFVIASAYASGSGGSGAASAANSMGPMHMNGIALDNFGVVAGRLQAVEPGRPAPVQDAVDTDLVAHRGSVLRGQ